MNYQLLLCAYSTEGKARATNTWKSLTHCDMSAALCRLSDVTDTTMASVCLNQSIFVFNSEPSMGE